MDPKDKYTTFASKSTGYRKGIHKVPKFTRVRLLACMLHTHDFSEQDDLIVDTTGEPKRFLNDGLLTPFPMYLYD